MSINNRWHSAAPCFVKTTSKLCCVDPWCELNAYLLCLIGTQKYNPLHDYQIATRTTMNIGLTMGQRRDDSSDVGPALGQRTLLSRQLWQLFLKHIMNNASVTLCSYNSIFLFLIPKWWSCASIDLVKRTLIRRFCPSQGTQATWPRVWRH